MKRIISFVAIAAMAVLGAAALRAQDADPGYYDNQGSGAGSCGYDMGCGVGCDVGCDIGCDTGYDISCGGCDVGCDTGCCGFGCGPYCGTGYGYGVGCCVGGCGCLETIAHVALTPVHWVASLLSCGSYGDCGCAPLTYHPYCNPCDGCGNWVGGADCSSCGCDDVSCGDCGYGSYGYGDATYGAMPNNSNGFEFGKAEPVGGRNATSAPQVAVAPQRGYRYTESILSVNRGANPSRSLDMTNQFATAHSAPASILPSNNQQSSSANVKMASRPVNRNAKRVGARSNATVR